MIAYKFARENKLSGGGGTNCVFYAKNKRNFPVEPREGGGTTWPPDCTYIFMEFFVS